MAIIMTVHIRNMRKDCPGVQASGMGMAIFVPSGMSMLPMLRAMCAR
jgi:hypothetical protein